MIIILSYIVCTIIIILSYVMLTSYHYVVYIIIKIQGPPQNPVSLKYVSLLILKIRGTLLPCKGPS